MSCRYHFAGPRVLVCVFEGVYSLEETRVNFRAGLDDDRAAGGVQVLIDITRSAAVKEPDDFRRVVQDLAEHSRFRGRIAVVPDRNDPLRYGMARQFAALTSLDGVPMEVFDSISAALAWLLREDARDAVD